MAEAMQSPQYYMKGKSKHLFWAVLVCEVSLLLFPNISNLFLVKGLGGYLLQTLLGFICLALLILYGLYNNVFAFRVVFFVMAAWSVVGMVEVALGYLGIPLFTIRIYGEQENGYWSTTFPAMKFLNPLFTIACMSVIMFHRTTGALLRISAALMILGSLMGMAIGVFPLLVLRNNEEWSALYITLYIALMPVLSVFSTLSVIFHYAVLSFSKMKPSKPAPAAPVEEQSPAI